MGRFDDPHDPMVVIVILGMIFGFVPFIVLVSMAPLVAALLVFSLVLLGVLYISVLKRQTTQRMGRKNKTRLQC